jgi:hypothetical protein
MRVDGASGSTIGIRAQSVVFFAAGSPCSENPTLEAIESQDGPAMSGESFGLNNLGAVVARLRRIHYVHDLGITPMIVSRPEFRTIRQQCYGYSSIATKIQQWCKQLWNLRTSRWKSRTRRQ